MGSNSANDTLTPTKLDELRKKFIIDEAEYNKQFLERHIEKTLNYAVLTQDGKVLIKDEEIIDMNKVGLAILTRYLGNKINEVIDENLNIKEIAEYCRLENNTVRAYLSKLVKDRYIIRVKSGMYRMNPAKIDDFLSNFDK